MKRRTILTLANGCLLTAPLFSRRSSPKRKRRNGAGIKKIVVCFLRGGNDCLNTMVPVDSTQFNYYSNLRPTLGLSQAELVNIPGDGFFGLHPGLAPLVDIIQSGSLALVHAVGYPGSDRSHFESQSYYETAVPGFGLLDGWLNRYLAHTTGPGLIRGVTIGSNIHQSVTGTVTVPVSSNFGLTIIEVDPFLSVTPAEKYRTALQQVYNQTSTSGNEALYGAGNKIFQMVNRFSDRNLNEYVPENGAIYPDSTFGQGVAHAAQMLKDDETSPLGVEVVTLNQNGYDTHSNQVIPGNPATIDRAHGLLLNELAQAMEAFYTDMGSARMDDTVFLVVSEFGRRAFENDSFGTDHGTGSLAMVMTNGVNAPTFNGGDNWPGLESSNLFDGGDLNWVSDFRDIYWEILTNHFGVDQSTVDLIIPGHVYNPPGII